MLLGHKQHAENENYWENELSSLRIEKKRKNELNDKKELEALATAIKEVYCRDYTTVYDDSHTEIDKPQYDYII